MYDKKYAILVATNTEHCFPGLRGQNNNNIF